MRPVICDISNVVFIVVFCFCCKDPAKIELFFKTSKRFREKDSFFVFFRLIILPEENTLPRPPFVARSVNSHKGTKEYRQGQGSYIQPGGNTSWAVELA